MKFGNITNPVIEVTDEIKSILDHGFDFVELGIEWPEGAVEVLNKKRKKILDLFSQFSSPAIGHTAWWMDFSSLYDTERQTWISEAKKQVETANKLDIKLLNFHSHSMYMNPKYGIYKIHALNNFVSSMEEIIKHAEEHDVQVMIENPANPEEIAKLIDYSYVMDRLPQAKVHLDVAHAFIHGGTKSVSNFIKTFNRRIVHLHFHDNHGYFDEHLPIGKGKINYTSVISMLKKIRFNNTVTFEVFTSRKDAAASMKKIKEMWA